MLYLGDNYRLIKDFRGMKLGRMVKLVSADVGQLTVKYWATGGLINVTEAELCMCFTHCVTRKFVVKEGNRVIANLQYEPDTEQYTLELTEGSTLYPYCDQPGRVIDEYEAKAWICDRVVPSGRHNIDSILAEMGHTDYKDIYFLETIQGRCVRDPYYICEIQS